MIKFSKESNTVTKHTVDKMIPGEFDIIKKIKAEVSKTSAPSHLIKGIGDDCAVYKIHEKRYGLFSTDVSVENVHFNTEYCSWYDIGFKSMSANISDIFAMGGTPIFILSAITIPSNINMEDIDEIYRGMLNSAAPYNVFIAGGDISSGTSISLCISIYGETDNPVYRNGASAGDFIYVTGDIGRSKGGLEILSQGKDIKKYPSLVERHLRPCPVKNFKMIIEKFKPDSMIDISDGLISDLKHLCEENKKGFIINCDSLPVHDELKKYCADKKIDYISHALSSGEEYELLFTSQELIENIDGITLIGAITENDKVYNRSGKQWTPDIKGYEHFRNEEG